MVEERINAQQLADEIANITNRLNVLKKKVSMLNMRLVIGEMTNGTIVAELCKPFVVGASDNKL